MGVLIVLGLVVVFATIAKRMGAIAKIREGKDPSTQYRQETPQINSSAGGR